ncbi:MAG: HEAT repeat domain-containing protein, partial [Bdellovibrionota bacterium]
DALNLIDGADLGSQIRYIKSSSRNDDGSFNNKRFLKSLRRFFRVIPFLFDANAMPLFQNWQNDKNEIQQQMKSLSAIEIENLYEDLFIQHLGPEIKRLAREKSFGQIEEIFLSTQNQFLAKEVRKVFAPITETADAAEERSLSLERVPAWVALTRGCFGADCALLTVPYHALIKGVRVYFIRKTNDLSKEPVGYAFSVGVEVNGKVVPYILTINGTTLGEVDSQMVVRAIAEDFQSDAVILPNFDSEKFLVNDQTKRNAMTLNDAQPIQVKLPASWKIVDRYMKKNPSGFENYYHASRIQRAFISGLPKHDDRMIMSDNSMINSASFYQDFKKFDEIEFKDRAQILVRLFQISDFKKGSMAAIKSAWNLNESQAQAVSLLVGEGPIRFADYEILKKEFGVGLEELLELDIEKTKNIFYEWGEPVIPLLEEILKNGPQKIQDPALFAVASLETSLAREFLIRLFQHEEYSLRKLALRGFGILKDSETIKAISQGIDDENSDIRWRSAWALREIGDPRAIPLLWSLEIDKSVAVRAVAERAIKELKEIQKKASKKGFWRSLFSSSDSYFSSDY